jgi:hypothetical protein
MMKIALKLLREKEICNRVPAIKDGEAEPDVGDDGGPQE